MILCEKTAVWTAVTAIDPHHRRLMIRKERNWHAPEWRLNNCRLTAETGSRICRRAYPVCSKWVNRLSRTYKDLLSQNALLLLDFGDRYYEIWIHQIYRMRLPWFVSRTLCSKMWWINLNINQVRSPVSSALCGALALIQTAWIF